MTTYPWGVNSLQTASLQQEINFLAVVSGKCPPLKEDGILGPTTCAVAARYAGVSSKAADVKSSCKQVASLSTEPCVKLPWNVKAKETQTVQAALNAVLTKKGFCAIKVDGVLGPTTCAAIKQVLGEANAVRMGCTQIGTLSVCEETPVTSDQPTKVAPAPAPAPTQTPTQQSVPATSEEPTKIVTTQAPVEEPVKVNTTAPAPITAEPRVPAPVIAPPVEEGMTAGKWAILGAGVAAVGAGAYFLLKKKK